MNTTGHLLKTVRLGVVSIKVPETYKYIINIDSEIQLNNGFDGNSIGLLKEALTGRTEEQVFQTKTDSYPYGTPTASDTTLLGRNTLKLEYSIPVAPGIGGDHSMKSFIFIEDDFVYTLEFGWTNDLHYLSLQLMYDILQTLQIQ